MLEKFLIGTYTKKTSEGVYEMTLDTSKKELLNLNLVAKAGSPTYVAVSKRGILYAIDKESENDQTVGGLMVYDTKEKPAKLLQKVLKPGSSPAYVTVDEARQLVYTANYHTGIVSVYEIAADGQLTLRDEVQHTGNGPRPEQADGPHPHIAEQTPDGRIVVADLGNDTVTTYDLNDNHLSEAAVFTCEPGFGPRHIVFDAKKRVAYLVGELSSNVSVLTYDESTGAFTLVETLSTIPNDWTAHNGAAAIRLTRDGQFLYVSNRGFNSIAVFETSADGHLTLIDNVPTEGDFPRDFNLSATEEFLVVVNQNTDNATLFERNATTGKLSLCQKDVFVPEGVCVAFE